MTRPRLALGDDLVCALAHGENVFIDVLSLGPAYKDVFVKTHITRTCSLKKKGGNAYGKCSSQRHKILPQQAFT